MVHYRCGPCPTNELKSIHKKIAGSAVCASLALSTAALAGANAGHKVAVHALPHDCSMSCGNLPVFAGREDITTTNGSCGGIGVFPVFFSVSKIAAVEHGTGCDPGF